MDSKCAPSPTNISVSISFASSGKSKTERNIRAGWFLGKHFEDLQKARGNADETE